MEPTLLLITLGFFIYQPVHAVFSWEACAYYYGNCTVIYGDGAIGSQSVNSVWIKDGYFDFGPWAGCPYQNNTCPNGFSYYGWVKFKAYPSSCTDFGVIVSTPVFNIQILGNGHLAAYAWLPNGTEYYAETFEPVMLDVYYPVVVQFQYFSNNDTWRLIVVLMSQLVAGAVTGRPRTYTPPSPNLLFGGSGDGNMSHNASIQLDRTEVDYSPRPFDYIYQFLIDIYSRQSLCSSKYGVLTDFLKCYWFEPYALNWTQAYSSCSDYAKYAGYPYGRLALFPSWDTSVWNNMTSRLAYYGNGSFYGYTAWLGGGQKLKWLNGTMGQLGTNAVVPPGVTSNTSTSTSTSCLQLNTMTAPWQWSETTCGTAQKYVCEMAFDCLVTNPCQKLGVCQPINDGDNICKCWPGTSGRYCENGIPSVNCINNCPCNNTLPISLPFGNCSICEADLKFLLKLLSEVKLVLKLWMHKLGFDVEAAEAWECLGLEKWKNFTQNIIKDVALLSCDFVFEIYTKIIMHKVAAKQFTQYCAEHYPGNMPANVTNLWHAINETFLNISTLPCFSDMIRNFKNHTYNYGIFKTIITEWIELFTHHHHDQHHNHTDTDGGCDPQTPPPPSDDDSSECDDWVD